MQKRRLAALTVTAALAASAQAQQTSASSSSFRTTGAAPTGTSNHNGRRLEDAGQQQQQDDNGGNDDNYNGDNYEGGDAGYPYDLSTYSVQYEKCQNVISWSDDLAEEEDATTVLGLEHFVVFSLCPSDSCRTCYSDYGQYVLPVEDYLASTTEQSRQAFENKCQGCEEACNDGGYCDESCLADCEMYQNLDENGYVDASEYIECQQIDVIVNDDDNAGGDGDANDGNKNEGDDEEEELQLYIGPKCSTNGRRIHIGLFTDEDCSVKYDMPEHYTTADYTGFQFWYGILSATYDHSSISTSSECMSCAEEKYDDDGNGNDNNNNNDDADDVNEMCEELYDAAAKCETKHGITAGFIQTNREEDEDGNYQNQVENEAKVCKFIDSLVLNSYTEKGHINLNVIQDVVNRRVTPLQAAMLTILSLSIVGTLSYAVWLNRAINIAFPSVNDLFQCTDRGTLA